MCVCVFVVYMKNWLERRCQCHTQRSIKKTIACYPKKSIHAVFLLSRFSTPFRCVFVFSLTLRHTQLDMRKVCNAWHMKVFFARLRFLLVFFFFYISFQAKWHKYTNRNYCYTCSNFWFSFCDFYVFFIRCLCDNFLQSFLRIFFCFVDFVFILCYFRFYLNWVIFVCLELCIVWHFIANKNVQHFFYVWNKVDCVYVNKQFAGICYAPIASYCFVTYNLVQVWVTFVTIFL